MTCSSERIESPVQGGPCPSGLDKGHGDQHPVDVHEPGRLSQAGPRVGMVVDKFQELAGRTLIEAAAIRLANGHEREATAHRGPPHGQKLSSQADGQVRQAMDIVLANSIALLAPNRSSPSLSRIKNISPVAR